MGVLLAIFVLVVGYENVWTRFHENDLMTMRREFAQSSVQMIREHPISGVGLGNWPSVYPRYAVMDFGVIANQAHCDWLQWTAEGGIAFGVLMASLFVWCVRPAFRTVWGLGILAVFLHALVDYPFSRPALGSWAMCVVALLASEARPRRASEGPIGETLPLAGGLVSRVMK
jgi:O-antigen ligase